MEGAFIFFVLNDIFRRTDRSEKGKQSIHKTLSNNMKDEK